MSTSSPTFLKQLEEALANARGVLLAQRSAHGHWEGELSSSALSTATAVCALRDIQRSRGVPDDRLAALCEGGLQWLAAHQNEDGGWGDTTLSFSNISTTALCWGAFAGNDSRFAETVARCEAWLTQQAGSLKPEHLATAIRKRYGKDHTFSVPILTALTLSGRLGESRTAWKLIPQLPFELAAFPPHWFAALRLPVVSYALPALIAIGQVRHVQHPSRNPVLRKLRDAVRERTLQLLQRIQPESGGYLEATPLTSFVLMSLAGAGREIHPVVQSGIDFLIRSARADGSWAIDSNLATWVTTLSVRALAEPSGLSPQLDSDEVGTIRDWLLQQQYRVTHPYTQAAPGGWAWTDLPGGVPDADDTPGAICALKCLNDGKVETNAAAAAGATWLLGLQNRDGGIPTFCRGWGALPFDRSSADLTAHTLRAWRAWEGQLPQDLHYRVTSGRRRAIRFLLRQQGADGSWVPLWFGNQHAPEDENPTYGTSRVLLALIEEHANGAEQLLEPVLQGTNWLLRIQNDDGGWSGAAGGPSSIEETALALEALAAVAGSALLRSSEPSRQSEMQAQLEAAIQRGTSFLIDRTRNGRHFPASPIGFYFAKLWYFETLYPIIYTVAALGKVSRYWEQQRPL